MVFALNYRRPSHVSGSGASISGQEKQLSINESVNSDNSGLSGTSTGIPGPLSFDRIIAGGTCPVGPIASLWSIPHISDCFSPAMHNS